MLLQIKSSIIHSVDKNYSSIETIKKGLLTDPNDIDLLKPLEAHISNYIDYSLHELPSGVLYGTNGATIEQCDELLEDIEEYKCICTKLSIDKTDLITKAEFYYSSYKNIY
jgi:hypothetical protein